MFKVTIKVTVPIHRIKQGILFFLNLINSYPITFLRIYLEQWHSKEVFVLRKSNFKLGIFTSDSAIPRRLFSLSVLFEITFRDRGHFQ